MLEGFGVFIVLALMLGAYLLYRRNKAGRGGSATRGGDDRSNQ
jgi:hypothetical protein